MTQALRTEWKPNRYRVAAALLGATVLFLLLMSMRRSQQDGGIASSRLAPVDSWSVQSMWRSSPLLSWPRREHIAEHLNYYYVTASPKGLRDGSTGGVIGGVGGTPPPAAVAYNSPSNASSEITEGHVIRTGSIEIIVSDPLQTA